MSDHERGSDSPFSQFSIEDDEIIWNHGPLSDTDFIVLRHPLIDAHSLPSTLSDLTGHPDSDGDLSSALDSFSLRDHDSLVDASSTSAESHNGSVRTDKHRRRASRKASRRVQPSDVTSSGSEYHSGTSTPTASYDDASAFISRCVSQSPLWIVQDNRGCFSVSFRPQ